MMNENILRGTENITSLHNTKQVLSSRGKAISRPKGTALGDVRNTLHSRSTTNNSSGKPQIQKSNHLLPRSFQNENVVPVRKASSEKVKSKPESKILSDNFLTPKFDATDIHNHSLCEQAEEACFNNILSEYKLSSRDLNNLVKRIKPLKMVIPIPRNTPYSPCEEIKMVEKGIWEDNDSSFDSFDDIQVPDVCPPDDDF